MTPIKTAYSYVRFSSTAQARGDSLNRQISRAREYAAANNLHLDTTLTFRDLGISAYDGSNVSKGALGLFLRAVSSGKVAPGSILIVEHLDRLSRAQVPDALPIFLEIINAGVTIVTLIDNQAYSRETIQANAGSLFYSIVVMQQAYDESRKKSDRGQANWKSKHQKAKLTGEPMTRKAPHWIAADKDRKYSLIPERVEVLKQILDWAQSGVGNHTIIKRLHADNVPAWSSSGRWEPSYVQKILRSPALYGGIEIDGDIYSMYPPVIDKERFDFICALRSKRATTKNTNRKGKEVTNLFSGLLKCGYCGSSMTIAGYKSRVNGYERKYFGCHGARTGKTTCKMKTWFIDELEPPVLFWLTSVDYAAIMNIGTRTDIVTERSTLAGLHASLKDAQERVERIMVAIEEGATGMIPRLKEREREVETLKKQVERQELKVGAMSTEEGHNASRMAGLVAMFRALKHETDPVIRRALREQLSAAIAATVERIILYPTGRKVTGERSERFVDVVFKNGVTRRIEPEEL